MKYLTFVLALLLSIVTVAQKKTTSVQPGAWSDQSTWDNGSPVTDDTVHINHNVYSIHSYDVGNGSITIWNNSLNFHSVANLYADTNGTITVYVQGELVLLGADLYCNGCTFINDGNVNIEGVVEFQASATLYNSCQFTAHRDIKFEENVTVNLHPGSLLLSVYQSIIIKNQSINNAATIMAKYITVDTTGSILGYGGFIDAGINIINNGLIQGTSTNYHYLWEGFDCIISGSGTENYVYICDPNNSGSVPICAPGIPTPVGLTSIEATVQLDRSVLLSWEVETEEDFSHYEINRLDGNDWIKIGEVSSKYNNLPVGGSYEYRDNPAPGMLYYRLRMVDLNGTYEYSPITGVQVRPLPGSISIYPNPVDDFLNLSIGTGKFSDISIIDIRGQAIIKTSLTGEGETQLRVNNLPAGFYTLEMRGNNETIVQKFMKN